MPPRMARHLHPELRAVRRPGRIRRPRGRRPCPVPQGPRPDRRHDEVVAAADRGGRVRNKLAAEFIGTFAMVFAGTGAIVIDAVSGGTVTHVGVALTFGLIVLAMIYAVGEVSGAHLNPAVTLGFLMAGRFPARLAAPYIVSQLAGALAASGLMRAMFGTTAALGATFPSSGGGPTQAFVM